MVTEGVRYIIVGFVDVFCMNRVDHEFLKCYRAANTSRRSMEIDYECATRAFLVEEEEEEEDEEDEEEEG